ncbi:MAG TPA: hypothetical protein VFY93_06280 [Planctomycetota bacterium]|nr:hypothetical protein [Planctomycetota bacterium]
MKDALAAISAGLWAPVRRPKLVFALWLARLVPIVLFFTLPVYGAAREEIGRNPQARSLLDASADQTGFAWSWTEDFLARFDAPARVFWLCLLLWLVVAVLAGGLVSAFVHRPEGPLLAACGRYAGRFIRLAATAAALFYLADAALNAILAASQEEAARAHFTQEFAVRRAFWRGILFPALVVLLGAVHSYARIDLVAHDRRSAFLSFGRGFGILLTRLPKLLLLELAMLLAAGVAVLVASLLVPALLPGAASGWLSFGVFLLLAALLSYLRTGIELGTLEARCRLLVPPAPPLSQLETVLGTPREAA